MTAPWFVEDGMIQAKGTGADEHGYIVTDRVFENFELVWDWKIAEKGNSGYCIMWLKIQTSAYPM